MTDTFIKAGLVKGWLIPPRNESPTHRVERLLMRVIWLMIVIGVFGMAIAWMAIKP
jgi:hypothetical protein